MSVPRAGLRIAVVGVSSLIGAAVVDELRVRKIPVAELHGLDDERSVGATVTEETGADSAKPLAVSDIAGFDFSRVDLAFFCGRAALSERYAAAAAEHAWVIDGSAAFRASEQRRFHPLERRLAIVGHSYSVALKDSGAS